MQIEIPVIILSLLLLYIILSIFTNEKFTRHETKYDPLAQSNLIKDTKISKKEIRVPKRDNTSKYIKESMLLNKPNHNLGFLPSNVRFMDLTYLKPSEIGRLPVLP